MSYYVHHTPGRLRVKIPLVKGNQERAKEVREILKELDGVNFIEINTVTGSVVVKYDRNVLNADYLLNYYKGYNILDKTRKSCRYIGFKRQPGSWKGFIRLGHGKNAGRKRFIHTGRINLIRQQGHCKLFISRQNRN